MRPYNMKQYNVHFGLGFATCQIPVLPGVFSQYTAWEDSQPHLMFRNIEASLRLQDFMFELCLGNEIRYHCITEDMEVNIL